MYGYILRRLLAAIPVMGFVALFVFLLLRLTPGDPAAILAGDTATPAQLEAIRTSLGLNDPLFVQFFNWISDLMRGDFGTSILSGKPVIELIADPGHCFCRHHTLVSRDLSHQTGPGRDNLVVSSGRGWSITMHRVAALIRPMVVSAVCRRSQAHHYQARYGQHWYDLSNYCIHAQFPLDRRSLLS